MIFEADGAEVVPDILTSDECDRLVQAIATVAPSKQRSGGIRNLMRTCPPVAEAASSKNVISLMQSRMKQDVFPVRVLFFDKTEAANWSVPWHQDLLIAVAERAEVPGFGPWSVKAGVNHVQPPLEILNGMAALRLHLDDCDASNGALRIVPGSHAGGILSDADVHRHQEKGVVVCEVRKGGALLMRPLILHASSPATRPRHRRVLHIEYASSELPAGLRWFERQ